MRIVHANAVYDPGAKSPEELLERYPTLTEWTRAVAATGATVSVIQRFRTTAVVEQDGITYHFVNDTQPPWLSTKGAPQEFIAAIAAQSPDVVHLNGLIFPRLVAGIRAAVGDRVAIVLQHHAGEYPIRGSGVVGMWQRQRWRNGLAAADAISVTAAEQAQPWRDAGVLGDQRIITVVEASTTMRAVNRERARAAIGASGDPLILWVGRKTSSADAITVLEGVERALIQLPSAKVVMLFGDDTLLESVEQRVRESALLRANVLLSAHVSIDELPNYYSAADIFASASEAESSGDALIAAMSAGLVPVVTDMPVFRAIAGECGARFKPGEHDALAVALVGAWAQDVNATKVASRSRFDHELSWSAIATRTITEYQSVLDARTSLQPTK